MKGKGGERGRESREKEGRKGMGGKGKGGGRVASWMLGMDAPGLQH